MLRKCWYALQRGGNADTASHLVAAFKILGLVYNPSCSRSARPTLEDVRRQYRELARLHHPDLEGGDDTQMKVINTAYELIQSHATQLRQEGDDHRAPASAATRAYEAKKGERGSRRAGTRHQRVSADFASGDDASWAMKSTLEWHTMVHSTATLTPEELNNPANHPLSHSKFFSFEDDMTIYRMIRGGATVSQVARTLGKPATFIEKRLQNAQFRNRVQYVLRTEKRQTKQRPGAARASGQGNGAQGATVSPSSAPNTTTRILRQSPYDDVNSVPWDRRNLGHIFRSGNCRNEHEQTTADDMSDEAYVEQQQEQRQQQQQGERARCDPDATKNGGRDEAPRGASASSPLQQARQAKRMPPQQQQPPQRRRLKEWEATYPRWRQPTEYAHMSLAEKGHQDGLLRRGEVMGDTCWTGGSEMPYGSLDELPRAQSRVFKMGRAYDNYIRLRPRSASS